MEEGPSTLLNISIDAMNTIITNLITPLFNGKLAYYFDENNILRITHTNEPIAFYDAGLTKHKIGYGITNPLRGITYSFQYTFGHINKIQGQQLLEGTLSEYIEGVDFKQWLDETPPSQETFLQLASMIAQIFMAVSLIKGEDVMEEETNISMIVRKVEPGVTLAFVDSSINTFGVIPVIRDLRSALNTSKATYLSRVLGQVNASKFRHSLFLQLEERVAHTQEFINTLLQVDDLFVQAEANALTSKSMKMEISVPEVNIYNFGARTKDHLLIRDSLAKQLGNSLPKFLDPYINAVKVALSQDGVTTLTQYQQVDLINSIYFDAVQVASLAFSLAKDNQVIISNQSKYRPYLKYDKFNPYISSLYFLDVSEQKLIDAFREEGEYTLPNGAIIIKVDANDIDNTFTIHPPREDYTQTFSRQGFVDYILTNNLCNTEICTYQEIDRDEISVEGDVVTYSSGDEWHEIGVDKLYIVSTPIFNSQLHAGEVFLFTQLAYIESLKKDNY